MLLVAATGAFIDDVRPKGQHGGSVTDAQHLVVGLAAWQRNLYRSVTVLLAGKHGHEAKVLLRTLLEAGMLLEFFWINRGDMEETRVRFLATTVAQEESLEHERLASFPEIPPPPYDPQVDRQELHRQATARGKPVKELPHPRDMAKAIGQAQLYWVFRYLSHSVHNNRLALSGTLAPLSRDAGSATYEVMFEGDIQTAVQVGHLAAQAVVLGTAAASELLGWGSTRAEVRLEAQTAEQLWHGLFQELGMQSFRRVSQ